MGEQGVTMPEDGARATGRTTRQVDGYIQWLFENIGKWIIITDHYESPGANKYLLSRIQKRLASEHPGTNYTVSNNNKDNVILIKIEE